MIACWEAKYHYNFWRPNHAIQRADADGNPATTADPTWLPLIVGNHPEWPSGHSCFTSSVTESLRQYFGTKKLELVITSLAPGAGPPRTSRPWTSSSGTSRTPASGAASTTARRWRGFHQVVPADRQGRRQAVTSSTGAAPTTSASSAGNRPGRVGGARSSVRLAGRCSTSSRRVGGGRHRQRVSGPTLRSSEAPCGSVPGFDASALRLKTRGSCDAKAVGHNSPEGPAGDRVWRVRLLPSRLHGLRLRGGDLVFGGRDADERGSRDSDDRERPARLRPRLRRRPQRLGLASRRGRRDHGQRRGRPLLDPHGAGHRRRRRPDFRLVHAAELVRRHVFRRRDRFVGQRRRPASRTHR